MQDAKTKGYPKKEFVDHIRKRAAEIDDPLYKNHGYLILPFIPNRSRALFFAVFDDADAYKTVLDFVRKNSTAAPKIDSIRNSICGGVSISLNEAKEL